MHVVTNQSKELVFAGQSWLATVLSHLLLTRPCEVTAVLATFLLSFSFQETGFTCVALAILEISSVDQGGL